LNVINDLILRGISAQLDHEHDTVPICQADLPDSLTRIVKPQAFHAVIHVAIEALPTPGDDCAWQDILDFKAEAHDKQWSFRRFLKTLATKQQSESEVRDDIEWMVSEYGKAMALHKLKASKTLFEAYIIPAVEVLEDLAKFNWTKIAKLGVSAKQRKIELLEADEGTGQGMRLRRRGAKEVQVAKRAKAVCCYTLGQCLRPLSQPRNGSVGSPTLNGMPCGAVMARSAHGATTHCD
jgi:hypothetical protein